MVVVGILYLTKGIRGRQVTLAKECSLWLKCVSLMGNFIITLWLEIRLLLSYKGRQRPGSHLVSIVTVPGG